MVKIKVRKPDGSFRNIVNSTSLPYAKRQVKGAIEKDMDLFFGEFEIYRGGELIESGTFVKKRIHWKKEI